MKIVKGGVAAPKEFLASGIATGVKKSRLDLALVVSRKNAVCAGFFTTNKVRAASVIVSSSLINKPFHRAVIINSGCANCLTGKKGILDAKLILDKLVKLLKIKKGQALICSTGVIGKHLDVKKISAVIPGLVKTLSKNGSLKMARAIMTTDTFKKEIACSFKINNKEVRIGGVAKGAGMIAPDMATMICVITSDADIKKQALKKAAADALAYSFNSITVDGDMSTNDTVLCLANRASGVKINPGTASYRKFSQALNFVALNLAKMIVRDGEGATKFVEIEVKGAKTQKQAKKIAFGIANSNLVKTAIFGCDPNIGRIASACGASDKDVRQDKLDIKIGGKMLVKNGVAQTAGGIKDIFKTKDIKILCDLKSGRQSQRVFTCDLSPEYVKINADYT